MHAQGGPTVASYTWAELLHRARKHSNGANDKYNADHQRHAVCLVTIVAALREGSVASAPAKGPHGVGSVDLLSIFACQSTAVESLNQ
jgi:hypothetical protein